ncbi:hypothetical protein BFG52_04725 [Acinetobacter larvae]|uniref:Uncharacterized protein n=1 Tax=Acinetobacter larvae TaxID=1789224 RepID=A0A1B2LXS2_9GAMM|nr:hypothetical protein BFG52_04725 [Acinetobacter larvae]
MLKPKLLNLKPQNEAVKKRVDEKKRMVLFETDPPHVCSLELNIALYGDFVELSMMKIAKFIDNVLDFYGEIILLYFISL